MNENKGIQEPREKKGSWWKEVLALLFLSGAVFFFWQQRKELATLGNSFSHTNWLWVSIGILLTIVYILLQSALYIFSFYSVNGKISLKDATELFLKRNVMAVFLPGGGFTALAYLPNNIRKRQQDANQVHHASVIYGFIGIFSVLIVAIPVLIFLSVQDTYVPGATAGFIVMLAMLLAIGLFVRSVKVKGPFYKWAIKKRPKVEKFLVEIFSFDIIWKQFWYATIISILIEIVGVVHLYVAMLSTGLNGSWTASIVGYIVATIFLIISPFLRGLGAIEMSLTLILKRYGFNTADALLISLLFRFFELWLPLITGLFFHLDKVVKPVKKLFIKQG